MPLKNNRFWYQITPIVKTVSCEAPIRNTKPLVFRKNRGTLLTRCVGSLESLAARLEMRGSSLARVCSCFQNVADAVSRAWVKGRNFLSPQHFGEPYAQCNRSRWCCSVYSCVWTIGCCRGRGYQELVFLCSCDKGQAMVCFVVLGHTYETNY